MMLFEVLWLLKLLMLLMLLLMMLMGMMSRPMEGKILQWQW
jgi:hypothetical protein